MRRQNLSYRWARILNGKNFRQIGGMYLASTLLGRLSRLNSRAFLFLEVFYLVWKGIDFERAARGFKEWLALLES